MTFTTDSFNIITREDEPRKQVNSAAVGIKNSSKSHVAFKACIIYFACCFIAQSYILMITSHALESGNQL